MSTINWRRENDDVLADSAVRISFSAALGSTGIEQSVTELMDGTEHHNFYHQISNWDMSTQKYYAFLAIVELATGTTAA